MDDIPKWVMDIIEKDGFRCRKCSHDFQKKGIISLGVRKSHRNADVTVGFFEYQCPACNSISMIELPYEMTLIEFSSAVLQDIEDEVAEEIAMMERYENMKNAKKHDPNNKKATKRSKSRITKAEQKTASKMLEECNNWEEWLERIGAPMSFAYPTQDKIR